MCPFKADHDFILCTLGNKGELYQNPPKTATEPRYAFIQSTLKQFHYRAITKRQKGVVIRFLLQVTGYSRQQLTRLINRYLKTGVVQLKKVHKPPGFKQKYNATDIALLAKMDERYDTPSGAVIKKLCERAYCIFTAILNLGFSDKINPIPYPKKIL